MMGMSTHGLSRVAPILERIAAGGIDAGARPEVTAPAPCAAEGGCARRASAPRWRRMALAEGMAAARVAGMAGVFVRRATHLGALAPCPCSLRRKRVCLSRHVEQRADAGAAGWAGGPRGQCADGDRGFPHGDGRHAMLDMALSSRRGRRCAGPPRRAGRSRPTGRRMPRGGPTTDARAAMAGLMQAIGGAKGASLAVMLDLMAAGLSGAAILSDVPDTHKDAGARPDLGRCSF